MVNLIILPRNNKIFNYIYMLMKTHIITIPTPIFGVLKLIIPFIIFS